MRKRLGMTAWYDPGLLVRTGIRVAISTVFGQMADRREAMAAANAISGEKLDSCFDYRDRQRDGDFWFDFVADTGDGWDPTFAMAQLLTRRELTVTGADTLPRGKVLILGGDQVYPTASREAYGDRFLGPFDEALETAAPADRADMPDLYAVPGNHDWYDGLATFFGLFCRRTVAADDEAGLDRPGRDIAGRPTLQTRSYFALRLPGNWWLWGTDSQLEGYIDQPQIDFFSYVASRWMEDESKLILCVGMPHWAYVDPADPDKEYRSFSYLERLAGEAERPLTPAERAAGETGKTKSRNHRLRLVLTGDSHHYSRFVEPRDDADETVHYVTCGGGGAFLHPTHQLGTRQFEWEYPPPGVARGPAEGRLPPRRFELAPKAGGKGKAVFPDAETSRGLTAGNLGFALRNPGMTAVFLLGYLLFNWLLNMNARVEGYSSLAHALTVGPLWQAPARYVWAAFVSPWPAILFAVAMGGYYYFADWPEAGLRRLKAGAAHGLVQAGAATIVSALLLWLLGHALFGGDPISGIWPTLNVGFALLLASAAAACVSATIFGLYLWFSLNRYGRHWNEAFSALAIADYKCFLRMRIDTDGILHLHPVGLAEVPRGGGSPASLSPHLIEGPVRIA